LYPKIEMLQARLGEINDLATAQVQLRQQLDLADERAERKHIKMLLTEEVGRLRQARQNFMAWFTAELQEDLESSLNALLGQPARCEARIGPLVHSSAS